MSEQYIKIKLKDACNEIFSGGTPNTRKQDYWAGDLNWLSSGETRNKFIKVTEKKITKKAIEDSSTRLSKVGDVLIASAGQGKTRGQVSFSLIDTYINQSIIALRTNPDVLDSLFLFYLFSGKYVSLRNISDSNSIRGSLTCKMFENMEILIPKKVSEQKKISSFLYNYDLLIEINLQRIRRLELMSNLIYDEWFVKFKFPGYEGVELLNSKFGEIPLGWEIKQISDFGEVVTGKTPSTKVKDNYGDFMFFVKTPDMHNKIFLINTLQKLSEKGVLVQKNKIIPPNSIMVSCIGTIGVVSINAYDSQTNQQINTIILKDIIYKEYLYFLCKGLKDHLKNLGSNGATMGNVNKDKFESIKVLCPKADILKMYSSICGPMFDQIRELQIVNQKLCTARDLLLPRLISGELDVSNLDIKVSEVSA